MARIALLLVISTCYSIRIASCQFDGVSENPDFLWQNLKETVEQIQKDVRKLKEREQLDVGNVERTCDDIHWFDPSAKSGKYQIDPDGPMNGAEPIEAYCDMDTVPVTTVISHDIDKWIDFSGSLDDGSEEQAVNYSVPMRQILALLRQSDQCNQDFQFQYPCKVNDAKWKKILVSEYSWFDSQDKQHLFANCQKLPSGEEEDTCFGSCLAVSPNSNETVNLPVVKLINSVENVDQQLMLLDYSIYESSHDSHFVRLGQLKCSGQMRGPSGPTGPQGPPGPPGPVSLHSNKPSTKSPIGKKQQINTTLQKNTKSNRKTRNEVIYSGPKKCPGNIGVDTECHQVPYGEFGCYCFVKTEKTWKEASKFCSNHRMHLLSVDSEKELIGLLFLRTLYREETNRWWTSGSTSGGDNCVWPLTGNDCDFTWGGWGNHSRHKSPKSAKLYITNTHSMRNAPTRLKSSFAWKSAELFSICEY